MFIVKGEKTKINMHVHFHRMHKGEQEIFSDAFCKYKDQRPLMFNNNKNVENRKNELRARDREKQVRVLACMWPTRPQSPAVHMVPRSPE